MKLKIILVNILVVLALSVLAINTSIAQTQPLTQPLKQSSILPKADPYCGADGYLKNALKIEAEAFKCDQITVSTVFEEASDWVLVELRGVAKDAGVNAATAGAVLARAPAFLLQNGFVVEAKDYGEEDKCLGNFEAGVTAGTCPLVKFALDSDMIKEMDLYVVVRHINHLDIISNEALTTMTEVRRYVYDFTDAETKAKGGSLALKQEGDNSVMYVGDVNGDTNINAADYLQIYGDMDQNPTDPHSDINFDGKIDNADAISPELRENLGRTVQVP